MDETRDLVPAGGEGGAPTLLADTRFHQLAAVPVELEWFANIDNPRTRRAYRSDLSEFMAFVGITSPVQFRDVSRAHVIAWRQSLEQRGLNGASIRRKLAALSSLYEYLCDRHAVTHNPVKGVKRPRIESQEGKTPALADGQARQLLDAPDARSLKGKRDRAILAVLLYHGLRRAELCALNVDDLQERRGVKHLRVHGKGNKLRYVPLHPAAAVRIEDYLAQAGHAGDQSSPLFLALRNPGADRRLSAKGVYSNVVLHHGRALGLTSLPLFGPHAMRATAATNALEHGADIAKVQEWLGHTNIQTTRVYDRRNTRPEDSPTFKVAY
jgi:site-specific recombinase XerD